MYIINNINVKRFNIINAMIVNDIDKFVRSRLEHSYIDWTSELDRKNFLSPIETFLMHEYKDKKLVSEYKLICDKRNITKTMLRNNKAALFVSIVQKNSVVVTSLRYFFNFERQYLYF